MISRVWDWREPTALQEEAPQPVISTIKKWEVWMWEAAAQDMLSDIHAILSSSFILVLINVLYPRARDEDSL